MTLNLHSVTEMTMTEESHGLSRWRKIKIKTDSLTGTEVFEINLFWKREKPATAINDEETQFLTIKPTQQKQQ